MKNDLVFVVVASKTLLYNAVRQIKGKDPLSFKKKQKLCEPCSKEYSAKVLYQFLI